MSETIRISGKTLEDAITNATIRLGVTSDNIVYTVIEHESRGFLGIGQKDAVIEVRAKTEADYEAERLKKKAEEDAIKTAQETVKKEAQTVEQKVEAEAQKIADDVKYGADTVEITAKGMAAEAENEVKAAVDEMKESFSELKESFSENADEEQDSFDEEQERAPRRRDIRPLANPQEAIEKAEGFLRDVYRSMGMDVELVSSYDGEVLNVQMNGDDMGILIGKRGQTLDSLQYLVSLVVNKGSSTYVRVKLDTENYRERRKATLENLAKNISVKVKKTRQSVYLEPMNPYERRIIHSALQNDPFVTTHSEGEEPDRKVVVTLRSDADLDALDRKYGERRSRGGRGGYRNSRGSRRNDRRGGRRRESDSYGESIEKIEPVRIPEAPTESSSDE